MLKNDVSYYNGLFQTVSGEVIRVVSITQTLGKESEIKYQYVKSDGEIHKLTEDMFNQFFTRTSESKTTVDSNKYTWNDMADEVKKYFMSEEKRSIKAKLVESNKKKGVNSDIIKLIESGYVFKSFFGDTLDGRSISLDLNEEE